MLTPVGFFLQRFMNLELRCGQLLIIGVVWVIPDGSDPEPVFDVYGRLGLKRSLLSRFNAAERKGGGGSCVRDRRLGLSFVIQKSNKLFQANLWLFIITKDFAKRCMIKELMLAICSSLVWKKKLWMDDQRSAPMTMWPTHPPTHTSRFSSET